MSGCWHCGSPLPAAAPSARVAGVDHAVCCHGCRAVAEWIGDLGLADYYRLRTASATPAPDLGDGDFLQRRRDHGLAGLPFIGRHRGLGRRVGFSFTHPAVDGVAAGEQCDRERESGDSFGGHMAYLRESK